MAKLNESPTTIRFTISEISKLTSVRSQEVFIHGLPWQIELRKQENGTQKYLLSYLHCTHKDKSPNWTAIGRAAIKLLPFGKNPIHEYRTPAFVYYYGSNGFGGYFIKWNNLFDENKKYVKDDTAKFEITIEAEDPNRLNRSIAKFEYSEKVCGISCELSITNVSNLMAVRSPDFIMHDMPWYILAIKHVKNLAVMLNLDSRSRNQSCQVTMSAKLVSSNNGVNPIEKSITTKIRSPQYKMIENIISWKEMLKAKKGFVNENSITLKIEIKAEKPVKNVPNDEPTNVVKRRRLNCSICSDDFVNQDTSVTKCGHMFCTACITKALLAKRICPSCKVAVKLNELRSLNLSA